MQRTLLARLIAIIMLAFSFAFLASPPTASAAVEEVVETYSCQPPGPPAGIGLVVYADIKLRRTTGDGLPPTVEVLSIERVYTSYVQPFPGIEADFTEISAVARSHTANYASWYGSGTVDLSGSAPFPVELTEGYAEASCSQNF